MHVVQLPPIVQLYVQCCMHIQFQKQAIAQFCARHPELKQSSMSSVYRHLLHEDKYGLVYCFVPKGGCMVVWPHMHVHLMCALT